MVSFYVPKKKAFDRSAFELTCESLDIKGQGVGKTRGCVWFCRGLLPGEVARVQPIWQKGTTGQCEVIKLLKRSSERLEDPCLFHDECGGCPLSHIKPEVALSAKADGIIRVFKKAGIELPEPSFIERGSSTGYRRCCRLSARYDRGQFHLGFREGGSKKLCDIKSCITLTPKLNALLPVLGVFLSKLECRGKIGHCDLVSTDGLTGINLRITSRLSKADEQSLGEFSKEHSLVISVQEPVPSRNATGVTELIKTRTVCGDDGQLFLNSYGIKIFCRADSFVQVNSEMNRAMVKRVLDAVGPKSGMNVLDLFCGIGNFTLPIAKSGARVTGVDVVSDMIELAKKSARDAELTSASFVTCDLDEAFEKDEFAREHYDAVVMDPGREGANRACRYCAGKKFGKVVLISCNPLAAARDIPLLTSSGYRIEQWGMFDMFPRTAHVETVVLLSREK